MLSHARATDADVRASMSSSRKRAAIERRATRAFFILLFGLAIISVAIALAAAFWR